MRYNREREDNLTSKLHRLLGEAARSCPDKTLAEMKQNHATYTNEDITEYVLVFFFDGRQICVHRTTNEGINKLGCNIIRVWERRLPNDKAIEQIGSEIRRMLGHRLKVREEVEEFRRFALEYLAEGMKL